MNIKAHKVLEMVDKSAAGCMIILYSGKVLLLKRNNYATSPLTWCIPGGRIDRGENAYEAALRETKEEANIDVRKEIIHQYWLDQVEVTKHEQSLMDGYEGIFTTFIMYLPNFIHEDYFNIEIDHESLDWGWFTLEEMDELELHPGMYVLLEAMGVT
jgi:8-oxo-dGTP pyrophosphatase MutT (NUDIX family)